MCLYAHFHRFNRGKLSRPSEIAGSNDIGAYRLAIPAKQTSNECDALAASKTGTNSCDKRFLPVTLCFDWRNIALSMFACRTGGGGQSHETIESFSQSGASIVWTYLGVKEKVMNGKIG